MNESAPESISPSYEHLHHVYALRRSGHHAVIHWLAQSYESSGIPAAEVNDVYNLHVSHMPGFGERNFAAQEVHRRAQEARPGAQALFVNYEDLHYSQRQIATTYTDPTWQNAARQQHDIVVVRDWYNVAASRLQKIQIAEEHGGLSLSAACSWEHAASIWLEHASLLATQPSAAATSQPTAINYNRWFTDSGYRGEIAAHFGVSSNEDSLGYVPRFARGSSFDEQRMQGNGQQMNVLRRWEDIRPDLREQFNSIIGTTAVRGIDALNRVLFGINRHDVLG